MYIHVSTHIQAAPIVLNAAMLRAHFNLPLNDAAKKLGVCATAIKKVNHVHAIVYIRLPESRHTHIYSY